MTDVLLLGAGKIGAAIGELLTATGDYAVTVGDSDEAMLDLLDIARVRVERVDATKPADLRRALKGREIVISALPFYLNPGVAEAALATGTHYFDLTEDVETTRRVRAVADGAPVAFVPQCGLAPGFISIGAYDLAKRFDKLRNVWMRVGALPQFPDNALKYNLTWSTDGLINEYCNPCDAVRDSRRIEVLPLEGLESFSLDGVNYEAFNTSGGLGTLAETLAGRVENLNYKTVRYPGHCAIMKMLVRDLRLGERRELLKNVLEAAVPMTKQDVVLVFVSVHGFKEGRLTQETYAKKIYSQEVDGHLWSAIQITTAAGITAMVDLLKAGQIPAKGFVRQEDVSLDDFLANRFGRYYA
jgi:saccharopine dehydrogenase-like NADP-dependent oxidoreductase